MAFPDRIVGFANPGSVANNLPLHLQTSTIGQPVRIRPERNVHRPSPCSLRSGWAPAAHLIWASLTATFSSFTHFVLPLPLSLPLSVCLFLTEWLTAFKVKESRATDSEGPLCGSSVFSRDLLVLGPFFLSHFVLCHPVELALKQRSSFLTVFNRF